MVISDVKNYIQPDFIQAKLFQYDDKNEIKLAKGGAPLSRYATSDDYTGTPLGIREKPVVQFSTPLDIYSSLTEEQKQLTNEIKTFCNTKPSVFIWHNGTADKSCQFHGLHIHIVYDYSGKLSDLYRYKTLKRKCQEFGLTCRHQKVQRLDALLNHLQQKPRIVLGCNNLSLCGRLVRTFTMASILDETFDFAHDEKEAERVQHDAGMFMKSALEYEPYKDADTHNHEHLIQQLANEELTMPDMSNEPEIERVKKLPTTKTASKVDILKAYMSKYSTNDTDEILKQIMINGCNDELNGWRSLCLVPVVNYIKEQACKELNVTKEIHGTTYVDKFMSECPAPDDCLTVTETAQLFDAWCKEQRIDMGDFMIKTYAILDKSFSKINCLMLQGESNAGKTYWTTGLLPFPKVVGQTIQSQDFAYQKCIGKEVIQIPELSLTKPEQVEESKKIFEGLPTQINIKHKEPRLLPRIPVILTCNRVPWYFYQEETETFRNRIFKFDNLKQSPLLQGKKSPNPIFFKKCFT